MNSNPTNLIFSTEGFANRADLAMHSEDKMAKLLRHAQPHVDRVRVHVKREAPHSRAPYFAVCATAESAGPNYVAHAESAEPVVAINAAFDKLERSVLAAARARTHQRRHAEHAELV